MAATTSADLAPDQHRFAEKSALAARDQGQEALAIGHDGCELYWRRRELPRQIPLGQGAHIKREGGRPEDLRSTALQQQVPAATGASQNIEEVDRPNVVTRGQFNSRMRTSSVRRRLHIPRQASARCRFPTK